MHHPSQLNLANNTSGIVHRAIDGTPGCQTRTHRPGNYTATNQAVTCKHCLKKTAPAVEVAPTRLSDDQLDGIACIRCHATATPMVPAGTGERGQLFECAAHVRPPADPPHLPDSEILTGFHAGFLSAVTILRDVIAELGLDPDDWAATIGKNFAAEEQREIVHTVKLILWRRRGVQVPKDPMGQAMMSAGILLGVELSETVGVPEAKRRVVRNAMDGLTRQHVEKTMRFIRDLTAPRYVADPEGTPCGNLGCSLCYVVGVSA